jgi:hypothetical protein
MIVSLYTKSTEGVCMSEWRKYWTHIGKGRRRKLAIALPKITFREKYVHAKTTEDLVNFKRFGIAKAVGGDFLPRAHINEVTIRDVEKNKTKKIP